MGYKKGSPEGKKSHFTQDGVRSRLRMFSFEDIRSASMVFRTFNHPPDEPSKQFSRFITPCSTRRYGMESVHKVFAEAEGRSLLCNFLIWPACDSIEKL